MVTRKEGLVYFLKADFSEINEDLAFHRIKVGKSTTFKNRHETLSLGSPVTLTVIRTIPHSKFSKYEKYIHGAFKRFAIEGKNEWFDVSDEVFDCIDLGTSEDVVNLLESLWGGLTFEDYCRLIPLGY